MIDFKDLNGPLNEYQQQTVIDAIAVGVVEEHLVQGVIDAHKPIDERAEFLIQSVIIPYNTKQLGVQMDRRIEDGEWTVMAVGGSEDELPFAYSIGASTPAKSFEVMCSGVGGETAQALINAAVRTLREIPVDQLVLAFRVGNDPMRFKVLEKPLKVAVDEHAHLVKHHVQPGIVDQGVMYVLVLADKNNRLPGEDDYDVDFVQIYMDESA